VRENLATQALKRLSFRIGSFFIEPGGFGSRFANTPDEATVDTALELIKTYIRARTEYDARNYLAAIEIATEDEA